MIQVRANWRIFGYVSEFGRSLPAVAKLTEVRAWLRGSAAQDGVIASPGSCVWSESLLGNARSIVPSPQTVSTVDRLLPTGSVLWWCDDLIKFGSLTSPACSPLRAGYTSLRMAINQRRYSQNLIVHSNRGAQFASAAYRQLLSQHGLTASMSRRGNCYDNAFIESHGLRRCLVDAGVMEPALIQDGNWNHARGYDAG